MFAMAEELKAVQLKYPDLPGYCKAPIYRLLKQATRDRRGDRRAILSAIERGYQTINDIVKETELSRSVVRSGLRRFMARLVVERILAPARRGKGRHSYIYSLTSPIGTGKVVLNSKK